MYNWFNKTHYSKYLCFIFSFFYINIFNKAFAPKAQMLIWGAYAQKLIYNKKHTLKITKYTIADSELKENITQKNLKHEQQQYMELQKYRREDMKKLYISERHERN